MADPIRTRSGRVLTDEDIDALADDAERGFDLSKWHHRPGRPALDASSGKHSPRIAVRVPADLHRRVHERASADGRNISQVLRSLLETYAGPARRDSAGDLAAFGQRADEPTLAFEDFVGEMKRRGARRS